MILVLNAGSSTLKFALFDADAREEISSGLIEGSDYGGAVGKVLATLRESKEISVVGHRVVHGGVRFRDPVLINTSVKADLHRLEELAPLHNPPSLAAIAAAEKALPNIPQVAVFDTAFYSDLPPSQFIYPLPYEWYSQWGVRRFGFHGISHSYCAQKAAEILGQDLTALNLISCHLGNGCSATATQGGRAIATTMGFTPLEGLMMGTRSGSVDPGILLFAQRQKGVSAEQLEQTLNHSAGLFGVSGVSADFREVSKAAEEGNDRARLALEIYAARVRSAIGALAVTMGRVDAIVFTAGVGENSAALREEVCKGLECLGFKLDSQKNSVNQPDSEIAATDSRVRALLIHTREELLIARETKTVL